ncbi:hypothetical protein BDV93DRAFT_526235 [Ceratobasidium sp. AG-I]|nr:hypothetical protein BDV93DRAFT_526235 [Ceratobasidium sp. AG-I]
MIIGKVSAWITDSGGSPLPEYQTKKIDEYTLECWIPSAEGTNFEIRWGAEKDAYPKLDLDCQPRLDGVKYSGRTLLARSIAKGKSGRRNGVSCAESLIRLFQFGKRELTYREDVASPSHDVREELNTIRMELSWGHADEPKPLLSYSKIPERKPIHERVAKKGHNASAELGNPTFSQPRRRVTYHFNRDKTLRPLVFLFRYASEDWLQAREIIPSSQVPKKPSSPQPKPTKKRARSGTPDIIDIDDLETDDEVVVAKRMAPAIIPSNKRPRKVKDGEETQPKLEL